MVAVLQPPKPTRRPILIDEACKILGKAKPTVYTLSRLGVIPSCRQGRKVYFYEDELLEYINSGKVTTAREIRETAEQAIQRHSTPINDEYGRDLTIESGGEVYCCLRNLI